MPIRDLLWACPLCGAEESIRPAGKGEACRVCNAAFRRVRGARIAALPPGAPPVTRHAAEWVRLLPPLQLPDDGGGEAEVIYRQALVVARFAIGDRPVRHAGRFLGRVERFGPQQPGTLVLSSHALTFTPASGPRRRIPLEAVSAVQPSSASLQIKPRREPLVAFRFTEASVRLWEELIQAAIRRLYRRLGKGEVVEFQPRIAVR